MMATVIVTPRSLSAHGHPALKSIEEAGYTLVFPAPGRRPSEDELVTAMDRCVGYIAGVEPISRRVITAAPTLKVISRNGVGVDSIDLEAANEHGVAVARATGANSRGVAELAIGHILCAARAIPAGDAALKAREWRRESGIELENRTLGLIGCGQIGRLVARFALAMDRDVRAYDPVPPEDFRPGDRFRFAPLDEVISSSDVISLHCPPAPDRYVIGENEISRMKRGVIIVNTARDGLVDTDAVIDALDTGAVRSCTVDAFATEPPQDFRLVTHPRVVATAHIGGFTVESVDRAARIAVQNLLAVLRDEPNGSDDTR
ncbi:MAG: phosphoglycerate dehydrogenase [Spirochaetales bacterium]|nr:phosphoglycerate dehydrogenase [Spirochaetales bacterium]